MNTVERATFDTSHFRLITVPKISLMLCTSSCIFQLAANQSDLYLDGFHRSYNILPFIF